MAAGDAYVFPGFLTPVLTQLFFPNPPTTFLTCLCRGERRKYAKKKSRHNWGSNSQPPGLESDMFTTEPPGRGERREREAGGMSFYVCLVSFSNIISVSVKPKSPPQSLSLFIFFLAHLSTTCSRGALRVVKCLSSVVRRQQFL